MPKFLSALCAIVFLATSTIAQTVNFTRTEDGIIVYLDNKVSPISQSIKLQVISDDIIRVVASPKKEFSKEKSLVVVDTIRAAPKWSVDSDAKQICLATAKIHALVSLQDGAISFTDKEGKLIVAEEGRGKDAFIPSSYDGDTFFQVKQYFKAAEGEAYYGLGQQQSGVMNYRGHHVVLLQYNTQVAVPFFVSNKNYGILWDNYSITKAGDVRDPQSLSGLRLYSAEGDRGWLTATYSYKEDPSKALIKRPESDINYSFLNAQRLFPDSVNLSKAMVNWEGAVESGYSGNHQFFFRYSGYVKVWIDGKLQADRWRQAWNPGNFEFNYDLEKGKKYKFKIEWIPDGSEAYISAKWLSPADDDHRNQFAFDSEAGDQIDYYFINGKSIDEVIGGYRMLTGRAPIMPKWSLGFWQSRERYKTQEEVISTVREFRKRRIPLDNIVLDWSYWAEDQWGSQEFDKTRFPDAGKLIDDVHANHARFMISVWPKFYPQTKAYQEFDKNGWLYKRNIADQRRDWIGKGYFNTFYDPFNGKARTGFWDLLNKELFTKGIDAWWLDASEPDIHSNLDVESRKSIVQPVSGSSTRLINAYPLLNAKGIYEGQRETAPDQRVFILTRSSFAGQQRFSAATWSGDIASRWHDMKDQITAGVNFSMSGLPYWTMDIGGFSVERRYEQAKGEDLNEWRELNARWYQFGAFTPLFRVHGQYPYREIYNIAPEGHPAYSSMLYYNKLRYRLMPYIYSLAGHSYLNHYTIMRGLVMDFSSDPEVNNITDQFMFGPSLLINPVLGYKAQDRKVYLPKGAGWYDLYNGNYHPGGRTLTAAAPYERIPVYVREGSIVPYGPEMQYTSEKPSDPVTLYVYTGKDAEFTLYDDEGVNYNYEKGAYSTIPLTYNEANKTLTIGKRSGNFKGMLENRTFNIVWVTKKNQQKLDLNKKANKTIKYYGAELTVKM